MDWSSLPDFRKKKIECFCAENYHNSLISSLVQAFLKSNLFKLR